MSDKSVAMKLRRRSTWKAKLGLMIGSIIFVCIALELGLRVSAAIEQRNARQESEGGQAPAGEFWAIYDPDLGYRLNPKFGDLNADGLRDHAIGPKNGRHRVLFLGDSILFYGDDIDDTVVGHLRAGMRERPGYEQLDIIDAGIKGFTNYQELQYLKKFGLAFEPDTVGVEFCLNDLFKFLHSFRIENNEIVAGTYQFSQEALSATPKKPKTALQQVVEKSYLLSWIKGKVPIAARAIAWRANRGFSFDYRVDIWTAWQDEPWEQIERQFEEMVALSLEHGFNTFVVAVPVAVQYNEVYLARDRDYVLKPQRKLREICERLRIPFLDLYPDLNASLFDKDEIHLTKEGRRFVGRRIAAFLSESQLVPRAESKAALASVGYRSNRKGATH